MSWRLCFQFFWVHTQRWDFWIAGMLLNPASCSESSGLLIRGYAWGCRYPSVRTADAPLGSIYLSNGAEVNLVSGALDPTLACPQQAHMRTLHAGPAQPRIIGDTEKVVMSLPPHRFPQHKTLGPGWSWVPFQPSACSAARAKLASSHVDGQAALRSQTRPLTRPSALQATSLSTQKGVWPHLALRRY